MLNFRRITSLAAAVVALASAQVQAEEQVDPTTLYEVSTEGTSTKVKAGEQGVFVLSIKSKSGAHVSDEAPLKLELKGTQVSPAKEKLALADSVAKKAAGQQFVDPRFEVPFKAPVAGKGTLDAKLTFFICSEKLCSRQQKTFSIPVEVL
jgi:hypothetical protein